MTVTKVVGFDLRIPKHFSLHFYYFSTFLYGIYKFAVFENKRKRKRTFASRPLGFCFFSREALGGTGQNWGGSGGCFPARFGPGGEGKVGEKGEGARAHLPVVSVGVEVACPRAPAAGGGPVPRLRHSGEGEAAWLGLGAPLGRGEAVPGVDWSCGRAEVGARRGAGGRRWSEPRQLRSSGLGRRWRGRGAPVS